MTPFIRLAFCYFILFTYQAFGSSLKTSFLNRKNPSHLPQELSEITNSQYFSPRILEVQEQPQKNSILTTLTTTLATTSTTHTSDKFSLSLGNIEASLFLETKVMILSKDGNTAFVIVDPSQDLRIVDISDPKSPNIIGSLPSLWVNYYDFIIRALVLSSDEKTLFIGNPMEFQIINITNLTSPQLVSYTKSKAFDAPDDGDDATFDLPTNMRGSMALDEKTHTLFLGGIGLQIYDVSNLTNPILLKNYISESNPEGVFQLSEINLSPDGKVLFLANSTLDLYGRKPGPSSLDIYDVGTNPKDIKLLSSLKTRSASRSMYFKDPTTILLLGIAKNQEIVLQEVNIQDYLSPSVLNSYQLGFKTPSQAYFLTASPGKIQYFIFTFGDETPGLLIFDANKKTTIKYQEDLISQVFDLKFLSDGKNIVTTSNGQFVVVQLIFDFPNTNIFGFSNNTVSNLSLPLPMSKMSLSPDGKFAFIVSYKEIQETSEYNFEIWNITELVPPQKLSSITITGYFMNMHFLDDFQTVFLLSATEILNLDISSKTSPRITKRHQLNDSASFQQIITTSDGKKAIALSRYQIAFFNFQDSDSEIQTLSLNNSCLSNQSDFCFLLLKDDSTLFFLSKESIVYDISNIQSPIKIASFPLFGLTGRMLSHRLSTDKDVLFVEIDNDQDSSMLQFYNVSIPSSPYLLRQEIMNKERVPFAITSDLKTGFYHPYNYTYLLKVDLSDFKKGLRVSGVIPFNINLTKVEINNYILSRNDQTISIIGFQDDAKPQITTIRINPQYSFYLKQEKVPLGKKYSDTVAVLNVSGLSDYNVLNKNAYKVIKLSLFDIKVPNPRKSIQTTSTLPSWIEFDSKKNLLSIEPTKREHFGTYTFHSTISLKIPKNAFDNLGTKKSAVNSENLLAWLISLAYIDNKLFLTDNFGSIDDFYLPTEFSTYKQQIYDILKKFYVETCTGFEVVSSLDLKHSSGNLSIVTPSSLDVKIDIKLIPAPGSKAQFLYKPYASMLPFISESKTRLSLEGPLDEINAALQSIVVDFENKTYCDANFTIYDGLNKPFQIALPNVSGFFKQNQSPKLNNKTSLTVQKQVDTTDAFTGQHFSINFEENTFFDDFSDTLTYDLATANGTALPTWLSLTGLKLRGSPPEQTSGRDLDLVLIAKNEFKQYKVPFKLHVNLSLGFFLKSTLKDVSYVFTAIGLLFSLTKLFNIFFKRFYKHPLEYSLDPVQEVTPAVIFPTFFVGKEKEESRVIIKYLEKYVSKKKQSKLLDYFIDSSSNQLQKHKIINTIQKIVDHLPIKEKKKLSIYCSSQDLKKSLINQLIIDQIIFKQLENEKETKSVFNRIKNQWVDFVSWDALNSKFSVDERLLEQLIEDDLPSKEISLLKDDPMQTTINTELVQSFSGPNLDLLRDSLIAHTFASHQINKSPLEVEIYMKQQVQSNCLFRFLKLDLKRIIDTEKNRMNYGINYKISNDVLNFFGVTDNNLEGKAVVIQITTLRNKILKEIWIRGNQEDIVNNPGKINDLSESILSENSYNIF